MTNIDRKNSTLNINNPEEEIPAGVSSNQYKQSGGFLNIARRGQGIMNLSARQDHHDLLSSHSQTTNNMLLAVQPSHSQLN